MVRFHCTAFFFKLLQGGILRSSAKTTLLPIDYHGSSWVTAAHLHTIPSAPYYLDRDLSITDHFGALEGPEWRAIIRLELEFLPPPPKFLSRIQNRLSSNPMGPKNIINLRLHINLLKKLL